MGKSNYPITKHVLNELRSIAKILPRVPLEGNPVTVKERIDGKHLLTINSDMKDAKGKNIDPNGSYVVDHEHPHSINHFRRLRKAYASGGWDEVVEYQRNIVKKLQKKS